MANDKRKMKPVKKLNRKMRTKMLVLFSAVLICICGLMGRLIYLVTVRGTEYSKKVLSLQSYDSQTIPFQRGDICDSNGTILATSVAVYNIILDCSILTSYEQDDITTTVDIVADSFGLTDEERESLHTFVSENPNNQYKIVKKQVSYATLQEFLALEKKTDGEGNLIYPALGKSVWTETEYVRNYPLGTFASSLIGFASSGNVGTCGLELYYDDVLDGTDGREYGYLNSDNSFEKTVIEPNDGYNLVTSIDANVQMIVEEKIQEFYEKYTNNYITGGGFKNCAVVIQNPNTGEIIAMANAPTFDLNSPRDISAYYTEEEIEEMTDEEMVEVLNSLWTNFCVASGYEPGSIQKPLTVACGLDTGTLDTSMTFECDGYEQVDDRRIKCVNVYGHGLEDMEGSLMDSCNDALMQMSYLIGKTNFCNYQGAFGFGQATGIDLPSEATCASLVYTLENMTAVDLATNCFGQNYNCSMVQMVSAFSSLVNGGYYYQPHIVTKITDSDGNTVSTVEPTLVKKTVSEGTSTILKEYLHSVVSADGTGKYAKVDGYSMGGKTGTSEKLPRDQTRYLVSFIGCLPYDNPEIVIYTIVDEPNVPEQDHSTFAQNITREILKEILPYLNLYPDEETTGINAYSNITTGVAPTYKLEGDIKAAEEAAAAAEAAALEEEDAEESGQAEAEEDEANFEEIFRKTNSSNTEDGMSDDQ